MSRFAVKTKKAKPRSWSINWRRYGFPLIRMKTNLRFPCTADQDAAQTNVRLYIPAKTMEFLFKEFLEYKALAEKEFHHKTKEESD